MRDRIIISNIYFFALRRSITRQNSVVVIIIITILVCGCYNVKTVCYSPVYDKGNLYDCGGSAACVWLLVRCGCANERSAGRYRRFYKRARSKNTGSRRPYMAMRRGAQNTIFGAPPVWPPPPQPRLGGPARGRPAIYGSGRRPSIVVVALLPPPLNPSRRTRRRSLAVAVGRRNDGAARNCPKSEILVDHRPDFFVYVYFYAPLDFRYTKYLYFYTNLSYSDIYKYRIRLVSLLLTFIVLPIMYR